MITGSVDIYTPIGGNNIEEVSYANGLSMTGSTGSDIPPEYVTPGYTSISWQYPGGISNKMYNGSGLWGYLLSTQSEGGTITTDTELMEYLFINGYLDESMEMLDPIKTKEAINALVSEYYSRVMKIDETQENLGQYGLQAFKNAFSGCYFIH